MKYLIGLFLTLSFAFAGESPVMSIGDLRQHHCENEMLELEKSIHELAQKNIDYSFEEEMLSETQERCGELNERRERKGRR